ncbi:MAG: hypothetical protein JO235_07080 [Chroococcidiopsidaceae cyanobacterium CP_BM_RX_35]|nr:hypothetical protein [Chroococcidiopsidaceae cyanobacterium CP_BM_RX_35]
MIKRPKIIKHQTQPEKDVVNSLDERLLGELSADANTSALENVSTEPEWLEPVEINVRSGRAMLSDVMREIRLDEKEAGLDVWEEAEDDLGNDVWWFDMA